MSVAIELTEDNLMYVARASLSVARYLSDPCRQRSPDREGSWLSDARWSKQGYVFVQYIDGDGKKRKKTQRPSKTEDDVEYKANVVQAERNVIEFVSNKGYELAR